MDSGKKSGVESSNSVKNEVNGEFRRRMSPRLNRITESDNAGDSSSGKGRASRRLRKDGRAIVIESSPEQSSDEGLLSPKSHEPSETKEQTNTRKDSQVLDSKTPTLKIKESDLNFPRRMSPRLHGDLESKMPKEMCNGLPNEVCNGSPKEVCNGSSASLGIGPDVHVISLRQVERRLSPRLHSMTNGKVDSSDETRMQGKLSPRVRNEQGSENEKASQESPLQRRLSPRLHSGQENGKEKVSQETPLQRRSSPRLHSEQQNGKEKTVQDSSMQKRLSPRLHSNQKNENQKMPLETPVGSKRLLDDSHESNGLNSKRSKREHHKEDNCKEDFERSYVNEITCSSNGEAPHQLSRALKFWADKAKKQEEVADVNAGRSDQARVKETLRIFNLYYLQFVQEQEERRKQNEIDRNKKDKASTSKDDGKRTISRPDLKALTKMRQKNEILYPKKTIGHLPGIYVGYQFYSRAEMVAIGFHSHWLNGIDYVGKSKGKGGEHQNYTLPIAVAVVLSGHYEDNLDNSDDIIYTGEGGNDLLGSKLQREDQVLLRGNLALKNSMDQSVPIRVIRGHKNADSYSGKIYSFDGLYKVVETWADNGCRGHLVYKYRLERIAGQPKLTTDQVQFIRGRPVKVVSELPGLVCRDISNGLEDICIPVTNTVDDPPICPPGFTYMTSIEVAPNVNLPPNASGCSCKGNCTNPNTCACAKLNGSDFPYVRQNGGRLVEAKDVVFECGPNCGCKSGCLNRISQRKIKYRLEVYRTPDKGWAVRSWDFIPSGAPVCEYIGVLRKSDELDSIVGNESNEYIFEIDCLHTINEIEGRERRFGNVSVASAKALAKTDKKTLDGTPEFCLDAGSRGNVARFINHSCEPNLFVQCILSDYHDLRLARVVLIAADNIPPMQELSYDYGYALDSVIGPDGKVKVLPCFCGTADCRKRLY